MSMFEDQYRELLSYQGSSPKPEGFDAFWDESLAEMHAVDPAIEIVDDEFQVPYAKCSHLYFTGVGGARVHAKLMEPTNAPTPHPALLNFHGYTGDSGDWTWHLQLAAMGWTVAALDCRGQGGRSEDAGRYPGNTFRGHLIRGIDGGPQKMMFRSLLLDTAQLARIIMDFDSVDADRVGATGGSQGGGLTIACAALEPRIRRAAARFPWLSDYRKVYELYGHQCPPKELVEFFRRHDPLHHREDELFNTLGFFDTQWLAPRIRAEILMGVGMKDSTVPPCTQFAMYNKITSPKNFVPYPDFAHECLPGFEDQVLQFFAEM